MNTCYIYSFQILIKNIFIILLLISPTKSSTLSFTYPTSITLDNGNIFIVHKTGVAITNPDCTEIIDSSSLPEEITEEQYKKISIKKFEDGIIICLVFDKIFVYSSTGTFIKRMLSSIASGISYYSLIPHYIDQNNNHYFIIAYFYTSSLYLRYYRYKPSDVSEQGYSYFSDIYYENGVNHGNTQIQNKGLTCEFLKNSDSENILTCFYTIYYNGSYQLAIGYFKITGETTIQSTSFNRHFNLGLSLDCIKSSTTIDHSKALVCYYLYYGNSQCFIYDLIDNIDDINKNLFEYKGKCK